MFEKRTTRRFFLLLMASALAFAPAPCVWDSDTLDDELRGLPGAFDLIVGRWHRHGRDYYEARVQRLAAAAQPTLAELDDLAVAYERLDRRDEAIATMAQKARRLDETPDEEHRYRYHANLGTFLAHAGRYDEALVELRAAVAIRPDAHFGRERFQIEAIEFVAAATRDPQLWRESHVLAYADYQARWFPLIALTGPEAGGRRRLDPDKAYEGFAGMLRFGGREGPVLYEALGYVFASRHDLNLAWWSFQRAIERGHPGVERLRANVATIEHHWSRAADHNAMPNRPPSLADYRRQRDSADAWLAAFQAAEREALARGEPVSDDAALARLVAIADREQPRPRMVQWQPSLMFGFLAVLFATPVLYYLRQRHTRAGTSG